MELVLSPGNLGGEGADGGPFRDEDVREWSRVDQVTGMLERARVETDRWRTNTRDAAHSYGKMIDSRERNSADGSLVQKARRQVEIFQSQGNGGRSFQVVRASQWSSSRATDCVFDVPITKPSGDRCATETMTANEASLTPKLGLWRASLERGSSDLERLSCLCRELHDEAIRSSGFWPTAAPEEVGALVERRSNSSEDVSGQPPAHELFARDCRTRRSLQIVQPPDEVRNRRPRNDLVAERARTFEEGTTRVECSARTRGNLLGSRAFASIADNDFVKNDPKHPSKVNQPLAKVSLLDIGQQNNQRLRVASEHNGNEPNPRRVNNKTVVHLRNAASPIQDDEDEPLRCINVTAIKLDNDLEPRAETVLTVAPSEDSTTVPVTTKPVKKVEFCKTEIHFAADSGKVNIVETDGKPPPTNKFRRRRRNNNLGSVSSNNIQKNNMPLVHFGDTFYEKYIFGGQGKLLQDDKKTVISIDNLIDDTNKNYNSDDSEIKTEMWHSSEKIRENGVISNNDICTAKDSYTDMNLEKIMDHNNKYRGTHTTTVNFLSNENNTVPKVNEDKPSDAFPTTNQAVYKDVNSISERLSNKNQIVSKDSENNQVLLKIVTTHKPTLARVENDHKLNPLKSRLKNQGADVREESAVKQFVEENGKDNSQNVTCTNFEAKDYCDNNNGINEMVSNCIEAPTYENIFDAISDDAPLYENFQVINSNPVKVKTIINGKSAVKKRLSNIQSEKASNNAYDRRHKKISSKIVTNNDGITEKFSKIKPDKVKSARSVIPISSLASTKNDKNSQHFIDNLELKRANRISSRLSNSRDNSSKRYKDTKLIKEDNASGIQVKRKTSSKIDSVKQEYKGASLSNNTQNNTEHIRTKKPVEVVYQTVVFNMKNEKLSVPTKTKEAKGPRLINDLICGSKMRRPADSKKIIKTAIVSQNTSKRKEMPSTMNRQ